MTEKSLGLLVNQITIALVDQSSREQWQAPDNGLLAAQYHGLQP
jgi:hypothetical protein